MQLGITCSFDVQEWWWNPPKTSPPLLNIFVCIPLLSSVWWRWHHLLGLCFHGASASVLALCGTLGAWQMLWREHCFVQVPRVFLSVLLLGCWLPASIVTLVRGPMSPWRLQTPATNAQTQWQIPGSRFLQDKWSAMASKEEDVQMMWLAVLFVPSWMPC